MQVLAIIFILIICGGAHESRDLNSVQKMVITVIGMLSITGIACFWR